ncbi:MAG: DUF1559 domain-containing protein [Planctomycetota bacterium]|nr:MAG: DUF1559 domain-containing protein [Planctomycetota bacterium]
MARPHDDEMDFRPRKKKGTRKKAKPQQIPWGTYGGVLITVLILLGAVGKFVKAYNRTKTSISGTEAPVATELPGTGVASSGAAEQSGGSEAEHRSNSKNNLKQIGLAFHNYHDVFRMFPAGGIVRESDKLEFMSWGISILPFVDQAPRYIAYNVNAAWNSPQNQPQTGVPIPVYLNPRFKSDGQPVSHYAGSTQLLSSNQWMGLRNITDGTSNTFFVGEVSAGFKSWADPTNHRDLSLGLGSAPDKFGGTFTGGSNILMVDGAVRFLSDKVDPSVLKALATPGGNEIVGEF